MVSQYIVSNRRVNNKRNELNITPEQVKGWFVDDMKIHLEMNRISRESANYVFKEILNDARCQDIFLKGKEVRAYRDSFAGFELVSELDSLESIINSYAEEISDCDEARLFNSYHMNGFTVHVIGAYNDDCNQIYLTPEGGMDTMDREDTWDYGIVIDFSPLL